MSDAASQAGDAIGDAADTVGDYAGQAADKVGDLATQVCALHVYYYLFLFWCGFGVQYALCALYHHTTTTHTTPHHHRLMILPVVRWATF